MSSRPTGVVWAMGSGANWIGQLGNGQSGTGNSWSETGDQTYEDISANVLTAGAIPELGGGIVEIARGYGHTLVLKGP